MTPRTAARLVALAALLAPAVALARPGGGDTFSGGGGHDFGGGGGGGGGGGDAAAIIFELVFQLIRLCVYYPKVGIPVVILLLGFVIYGAYQKHKNKDWDSGPPVKLEWSSRLDDLRRFDPDFSQILFEDFVFRLYATAHRARSTATGLDGLTPYLSAAARAQLAERGTGTPVDGVVIGALRVFRVDIPTAEAIADDPEARVRVGVELETNYTVGAPGAQKTYYAVETWTLSRRHDVKTRPPTAARTFPCPNCGAPWQGADSGTGQACAYCGEVVDNGRFDWLVERVTLRHAREQPPTLTAEVPERGTDLPTYIAPGLDAAWLELLHDDPALSDVSLIARLHHVYSTVNGAWAAGDLLPARGVLSDGLFDYLQYWMTAYRAQGLRNVLEGMTLTHHQLARLTRDRWFDALTVRIWGTGKDYVVRTDDGSHVRGSRSRPRRYSEYWTLIRSAARRGPTRADPACGNCGAPLVVTMAGGCHHCGAHVTAGEFDWVLSKIEQDDSYRG
ncbi:MAG: TIM44-like domain-containing protein [Kofleriaceae bacterium]|nr:TIM44-like domain-containing protein [Kofleriaceae bacterium]MCL4223036.1 TIM44-like domain-containing protein [Myxococcales bacterium]